MGALHPSVVLQFYFIKSLSALYLIPATSTWFTSFQKSTSFSNDVFSYRICSILHTLDQMFLINMSETDALNIRATEVEEVCFKNISINLNLTKHLFYPTKNSRRDHWLIRSDKIWMQSIPFLKLAVLRIYSFRVFTSHNSSSWGYIHDRFLKCNFFLSFDFCNLQK